MNFTSTEIQNELRLIMANHVLRKLIDPIQKTYFSIIANEASQELIQEFAVVLTVI